VASRTTIRSDIRLLLAVETDDPAYPDATLNSVIHTAVDSLVTDINRQNPGYNTATVTLTADSSTSHLHTFATQATALEDFARWLEVRWTDAQGLALHEVRLDELRDAGPDHFVITGVDSAGVLETSPDSEAGKDVWMRYQTWPALLTSDSDVPGGIPLRFHDVIALEAIYAFALGGEQRTPPDLKARWFDRRAQLISHVGQRGVQNARSRIYADVFE
jgi:hypothetical protein